SRERAMNPCRLRSGTPCYNFPDLKRPGGHFRPSQRPSRMSATAPLAARAAVDTGYAREDKYTRAEGRIYLSGVQALVRLPLMQQMRDRAAGLNTGGFISGYRGSPLGGFDLELWKAKQHLAASNIQFTPGLN